MKEKKLSIHFDLENAVDRRVYYAIKNLPGYYKGAGQSKALIRFINDLVAAVGECEKSKTTCEKLLETLVGEKPHARQEWN